MNTILLNFSKLLTVTKSDKSGLNQLKNSAPKPIKEKITKFQKQYKPTIAKITSNRNRIISHVDITNSNAYYNMGFSEIEINRQINNHKDSFNEQESLHIYDDLYKKLENNKSLNKSNEKYSPSDFYLDFEIFGSMIDDILHIVDEVNNYYYKK